MIWGLIIILAAGVILLAIMSRPVSAPSKGGRVDRALVSNRWQAIEAMAGSGAAGLRGAVSEADKLLDYVLKNSGFAGQTMAERLKRAERELSDKESVWRAHKLRNAYAHDVEIDLVPSQAKEALADLKAALKDLRAL